MGFILFASTVWLEQERRVTFLFSLLVLNRDQTLVSISHRYEVDLAQRGCGVWWEEYENLGLLVA